MPDENKEGNNTNNSKKEKFDKKTRNLGKDIQKALKAKEADKEIEKILQGKLNGKYASVEEIKNKARVDDDQGRKAKQDLTAIGKAIASLEDKDIEKLADTGKLDESLPENLKGIEGYVVIAMRESEIEAAKEAEAEAKTSGDDEAFKKAEADRIYKEKKLEESKVKLEEAEEARFKTRTEAAAKAKEAEDAKAKEAAEAAKKAEDDRFNRELELEKIKLERAKLEAMSHGRGRDVRGAWDEDGNFLGLEDRDSFQVVQEKVADALKDMARDLRFDIHRPPEWFKRLPPEIRSRLEVVLAVNDMAVGLKFAGKDYDVIQQNRAEFGLKLHYMNALFDDDFKMVASKLVNDLCEFYLDQSGNKCLRYKEVNYLLPKKDKDGNSFDKEGNMVEIDDDGFVVDENKKRTVVSDDGFITGKNGEKIKCLETEYRRDINKEVKDKLLRNEDYKEELVMFLAKKNGSYRKYSEDNKDDNRNFSKDSNGKLVDKDGKYVDKDGFVLDKDGNKIFKPSDMDRINAYTMWNLFYGMGDSSLCDRLRVLPTAEGLIADAIRTLNPESKFYSKEQIKKGEESLDEAEYFPGKLAHHLINIMKKERKFGHSINGKNKMKLREKILTGKDDKGNDFSFMDHKTMYGFLDFVNGGRDLYAKDGRNFFNKHHKDRDREVTLAELLMDYQDQDKRTDFDFGTKKITFLNEFHDALEAAVVINQIFMSKIEKDPTEAILKLKSALGMANSIKFNERLAFSYARDPKFWRDILIGAYGYDERFISSDAVFLKREIAKDAKYGGPAYNLYLYNLLNNDLKLTNENLNINEIMRLLGAHIKDGECPYGLWTTIKNLWWEQRHKVLSERLGSKFIKIDKYDVLSKQAKELMAKANTLKDVSSEDYRRTKLDFNRAIKMENLHVAEKKYEEMIRLINKSEAA